MTADAGAHVAPERIGHYRVIDTIGRGGMGYVYRAEDMRLKRQVALKVMNHRYSAAPNSRQRFLEEARAMAAIVHDNVVTIYEVGEKSGILFMAMELLHGSTLEPLIRGAARPGWERVLEIGSQLFAGLEAAHQRGIVHRDVKPGNVWVEQPSGRVKVLDFGLALAASPVDAMSDHGTVIGTPGYLSPEQGRCESLDDRSDLFSAGVVLYELVCGRSPFPAASLPEQLVRILSTPPDPIDPQCPAPLAELILRLLAKEPRDRFVSAAACRQAFVDSERRIRQDVDEAMRIVTKPTPPAKPLPKPVAKVAKPVAKVAVARPGVPTPRQQPAPSQPVVGKAVAEPVQRSGPERRPSAAGAWVRDKRIWLPLSSFALLVVAGLIWSGNSSESRPKVAGPAREQSVSPTPLRSGDEDRDQATTAGSTGPLNSLRFAGIDHVPAVLEAGFHANCRIQLANHAEVSENDPRRAFQGTKTVAQIAIFVIPGDGVNDSQRIVPAFPKKLSTSVLPEPGGTREVLIDFATTEIPPGKHELVFELQSPKGVAIDRITAALQIAEDEGAASGRSGEVEDATPDQ